jgi:pyruvate dehydrogenase (quinone)
MSADRAASVLNEGKKVAILIGRGAIGAASEVAECAEKLGAGVAKALLGRAALPDDLPFVTGPIGLLGSRASYELMEGCDTLLLIGTSFPYSEWLPKEGQAKCVQIDLDGRHVGMRYPVDVPLVGDAKETLRALLPLLERKEDRGWRKQVESQVAEWWRVVEDLAMLDADPVNPQRVIWELSQRLPADAIVTADSGSSTNWWARMLKLKPGNLASLSGTLATMGPATPYAIAAKLAHPQRPVIAIVGDGAFQMNGMNELITVKRYADRFEGKPALVFCVFKNQDLNQVTWEQRALTGDPKYPGTQWIPDFPHARFAELVGVKGISCEDPDSLGGAWDEALATKGPVLLEVRVDAEIPPLPPHIRWEQAEKMAKAMAKGDPEFVGVMQKSLRGKLQEFKESLPGRS